MANKLRANEGTKENQQQRERERKREKEREREKLSYTLKKKTSDVCSANNSRMVRCVTRILCTHFLVLHSSRAVTELDS